MKANTALLIALLTALIACEQPQPTAINAWIRPAPSGMPMTAGYMVIENPTKDDITISHVSSDVFADIELHKTEIVDGKATMREQKDLTIPGGGQLIFEPGGLHLMLMDFEALELGQKIPLTIHLKQGQTIEIVAEVSRGAPGDN